MRLESAFALQASLVAEASRVGRPAPRSYGLRERARRAVRPRPDFVPGVALGVRPGAEDDHKLAIRVQREELLKSRFVNDLIDRANGEAEVRVLGRVRPRSQPTNRVRPLAIGASASHHEVAGGTLGCFVQTPDGRVGALSNNHVFANENRAAIDDVIVQPSPWDGGSKPEDAVARLAKFEPLDPSGVNRVDCAVAELDSGIDYDARGLLSGGNLSPGVLEPLSDLRVEKIGRSSGRTSGRISALNVVVLGVEYDIGHLQFDGQLEIEDVDEPFSADGDSGALVFDAQEHRPVGLLFSGDDEPEPGRPGVTYANPLGEVLRALGVALLE